MSQNETKLDEGTPGPPLPPLLTGRQKSIVEFYGRFVAQCGYPPSIREIGEAVGLASTSSVHHQLRALEEAGVFVRTGGLSRALALAETAAGTAVALEAGAPEAAA